MINKSLTLTLLMSALIFLPGMESFAQTPIKQVEMKKTLAPALLKLPDLGMYGFLKLGKNQREVKWGETIVLTPEDATLISAGKPAFEVYYACREYNGAPSGVFKNKVYFNNAEVSIQTNLNLNAMEIKKIHTQAYLGPVNGKLEIHIDADNEIKESREDNNFHFWVNIQFRGFDGATPVKNPDLGMYGFLKLGKFQRQVKWGETIILTPKDATLISGGKPAFEVYYACREYNGKASTVFKNKIFFNDAEVSIQTNLTLNAMEIRDIHTQAYLGPANGTLKINIDADNEVMESREDNNFNFTVTVQFQGF